MTALDTVPRGGRRVASVDIAGTDWPLYKLEALAVGALTLLALFVITRDPQTAVLASAGATTVVWIVRRLHYRGHAPDTAARPT